MAHIELHQAERRRMFDLSQIASRCFGYPALVIRSQTLEAAMRAHQIMTRSVITVTPDTTAAEAATTMLQRHVSGLPVVDTAGKLIGIISEGDFLRRGEIGTQRRRPVSEVHSRPGQGGDRIRSREWPQDRGNHDAGAVDRR
jgi:hypothetical protein